MNFNKICRRVTGVHVPKGSQNVGKLLQDGIASATNLHMVKTDVLLDDSYKCCAPVNKSVNIYFELFLICVPTLVWFLFSKAIRSNIWIKFLGLIETSLVVKLLLLDTFFSIMGKVVVFKVKGNRINFAIVSTHLEGMTEEIRIWCVLVTNT